jgi:hypothetical protein
MMASLDIGEALGAGFRLVSRRPLDCLVWGVTYFLFAFLPVALVFTLIMPHAFEGFAAASAAGRAPTVQDMRSLMGIQAVQPVIWIGSIAGRALVYSAVFRAVMTPEDRGFFGLKFSSAELWVGLVLLVQMICMFLVIMGLGFVSIIFWVPTFMAGAHRAFAGWEVPVGLVSVLAAGVVFIWLFVRFSMAAPMSFMERQFRLFESWGVTRGHGWGLFAIYLVTSIIVACIALVVEGVIVGVGVAIFFGGGFHNMFDPAALMGRPDQLFRTLMPIWLGLGALGTVVGGYFMALMLAPWAKACQQLTQRADPVPSGVF